MKIYLLALVFFNLFSCHNLQNFDKETLIGEWESTSNKHLKIKLVFTESEVIRFENGNKIKYDGYRVNLDTLVLIRGLNNEKHLIKKLRKDLIKFNPINPNEVDIELIDILEFRKTK